MTLWMIILMGINLVLLAGTVCVLVLVHRQSARIAHLDEMSKQLITDIEEHGWHEEETEDAEANESQ